MCNNEVIPKATRSTKMTPHFAHLDRSKCNAESMLHWWFKHKFIDVNDDFYVKTNQVVKFKCKSFELEKAHSLVNGTYKPDLTIHTYCGNKVHIEIANKNKKKLNDYIDKWIELNEVIVEVDIKHLTNNTKIFNALFWEGKCFNVNKKDRGYYDSVGKFKEFKSTPLSKDLLTKLDWFWDKNTLFNNDEISHHELIKTIESANLIEKNYLLSILKKSHCSKLYSIYKEYLKSQETQYFEKPLPKDSRIKEITNNLNLYLKTMNKDNKIIIERNSNKVKTHYWKNGRKISKWVTDGHYYYLKLMNKNKEYPLIIFRVTKYIYSNENIQEVLDVMIEEINVKLNKNN